MTYGLLDGIRYEVFNLVGISTMTAKKAGTENLKNYIFFERTAPPSSDARKPESNTDFGSTLRIYILFFHDMLG